MKRCLRTVVSRRRLTAARWVIASSTAWAVGGAWSQADASTAVEELTLEALGAVPVTSVTGRPQALQGAPAAIYVISAEDIRRAGARTLPEALRLAPNLQVARLNASQWAISSRGFNNAIGNKLLVLVDGRAIYSPLFSGVFWDAQDVLLEAVERIEVISGPGATLWGANAVNGVINVITRTALGTVDTMASVAVDRSGHRVSVRQGFALGSGAARLYALQSRHGETDAAADGAHRADGTRLNQIGFRADWVGDQALSVQGDAYEGGGEGRSNLAAKLSGANLLARLGSGGGGNQANWQLQVYVDHARRRDDILFQDTTNTADVSFNHAPHVGGAHKPLWGLGHRVAESRTVATPVVRFQPETRMLRWSHVFVQDEITMTDTLRATVGAKVETNVYTGAEFLPSLRLALDVAEQQLLWASLSRAVRSPARLDRDFYLPGTAPYAIEGGPNFRSETANVAEVGFRGHRPATSYSATAFFHDYDRLRAGRDAPTAVENRASGKTWGLELWGSVDIVPGWRLSAGWVELRKSLKTDALAPASSIPNLGNDPRRQVQLRSSADLTGRLQLDATLRHVSALPDPVVPGYTVADVRLGWKVAPSIEASLYVRDLGDGDHFEYNVTDASRIRTAGGVRVDWRLP